MYVYTVVIHAIFLVYSIREQCDVQINGIAYDWSSGNVYWTDGEFHLIFALPTNASGKYWKPIITTGLTSPRDIVVDAVHRYVSNVIQSSYGSVKDVVSHRKQRK